MQSSQSPHVHSTVPIPHNLQFEINEYFTWYDAQSAEEVLFNMMELSMINPDFELDQTRIAQFLFFYARTKQLIKQLQPFTTVFNEN